jgi:RNA polymerase sigma factor (sigma-70 family)
MNTSPSRPSIAAWFDQYHDQLLRFLARSLGQQADAQDLAQEVFLRILRVEDPDLIQHPRAYLYRIAVNVIQEWRLRDQRFPIQHDQDLNEIPCGSHEPMAAMEAGEQAQRVNAAVADLPAVYRAVLMLRVAQGLTHNEVAVRLGISPRMVKRYLIKAYARMRERLSDADSSPHGND